jgi:IS30 family transposase
MDAPAFLQRRFLTVPESAEQLRVSAKTIYRLVERGQLPALDASAYRKKQMAKAHDKVKVCAHARIVGVVFWDCPHNVTGRAPNSIELHPILDFACFS